jgi:ABC-type nickel/cobalt efflux system permease component RcnA
VIAMTLAAWFALPSGAAHAHPLGNFTVNRAAAVRLLPGEVRIDYVVDMAEIPTFQEVPAIDADGDGAASAAELTAWAGRQASELAPGLVLAVDGASVELAAAGDASAELLPGQAGLDVLRFEATFTGSVPDRGSLRFDDRTDDGRIGWREVTATGADGVAVSASTVPAASPSRMLTAYPQDALASPLDVRSMSATYGPGESSERSASAASPAAGGRDGRPATEGLPFAGILTASGLPLLAVALLVALGLGAWHAILPGHGKTLMAATMVGAGARARQAVAVAVAVALMHSASVLALGLTVLALERTFRPEAVYPWLGTVAGVAAVVVGIHLLRTRWHVWRHRGGGGHHDHAGHHHLHGHGTLVAGGLGPRGLVALALAGGILPAPSALLVLLASIQAHRVAYGLGLVVAFSAGLAAALLGVGLGALRAREVLARRLPATVSTVVPIVSAAAIVLVGATIAIRGLTAV